MTQGFREVGLGLALLAFSSSHVVSQKEQDYFLNPRLAPEHPASRHRMNWVTSQSPRELSVMQFQERTGTGWVQGRKGGVTHFLGQARASHPTLFGHSAWGLVLARRCRPGRACGCKQRQGLGRREVSRAALNACLRSFPVPQNQGHKRLW